MLAHPSSPTIRPAHPSLAVPHPAPTTQRPPMECPLPNTRGEKSRPSEQNAGHRPLTRRMVRFLRSRACNAVDRLSHASYIVEMLYPFKLNRRRMLAGLGILTTLASMPSGAESPIDCVDPAIRAAFLVAQNGAPVTFHPTLENTLPSVEWPNQLEPIGTAIYPSRTVLALRSATANPGVEAALVKAGFSPASAPRFGFQPRSRPVAVFCRGNVRLDVDVDVEARIVRLMKVTGPNCEADYFKNSPVAMLPHLTPAADAERLGQQTTGRGMVASSSLRFRSYVPAPQIIRRFNAQIREQGWIQDGSPTVSNSHFSVWNREVSHSADTAGKGIGARIQTATLQLFAHHGAQYTALLSTRERR